MKRHLINDAVVLMAMLVAVAAFFTLGKFLSVYDAAAMAATFGSVGIVAFIVGTEFLACNGQTFGAYMVAIISPMESPAIVAPAAMRHAVPESNPGLVELLSLGITFPFNITLGIPLYLMAIRWLWGMS